MPQEPQKRGVSQEENNDMPKAFISELLHSRQKHLPEAETKWCIDLGRSAHICNMKQSFEPSSFTTSSKASIKIGDEMTPSVSQTGKINETAECSGKQNNIELKKVLLVPTLKVNLVSVSLICKNRYTVAFTTDKNDVGLFKVIENLSGALSLVGIGIGNVFYKMTLEPNTRKSISLATSTRGQPKCTWHKRQAFFRFDDRKITSNVNGHRHIPRKINKNIHRLPAIRNALLYVIKKRGQNSIKSTKPSDHMHIDLMSETLIPL